MKNQLLIHAAFAVLILGTGCNKQSNSTMENPSTNDSNSLSVTQQLQGTKEIATNAWQKTKEVTTNTLADVKEGTANAWANTKKSTLEAWNDVKESVGSAADYAYDKKDEFVTKARADLDALDAKIKELSDKTVSASDSVKADAQAKLQA